MALLNSPAIKYFTADIIETAAKGDDSVSSQAQYHNALTRKLGERLTFIKGNYSIYKAKQPLISADAPERKPRDCEKVQVWKFEEKQSDVNIALHMFDDAMQGEVDQVVLVTNDTDLVPAFKMLEARCPDVVRGLIIPTRKNAQSGDVERQANTSLSELAHWVRKYITDEELQRAQLPDVVTAEGGGRASKKPLSWYPRPDHLEQMIAKARPVLKSEGKIMRWAREANQWLDGQKPMDLIETEEGAAQVFAYIEKYIEDQIKDSAAM